jgi:hypothetical protein
VVVSGESRLDGAAFDSPFVGAVILRDGLVTPCQVDLPPVRRGRYSVRVHGDDAAGCGRAAARVVLWTFAGEQILYSTNSVAWPSGGAVEFAAAYSSADPAGAAPTVAQFSGTAYGDDGKPVKTGTLVEAFVGETRCGIASTRSSDGFVGYSMDVVGPDAVPGCTRDVPITFRVGGVDARHNPVPNRPPGVRDPIDLRL